MKSPLKNISVLDFTHLLPGELCSTILTDLGARVLRVEPLLPGLGKRVPPIVNGESLYYWSLHRNKGRICLDLKSSRGAEIVRELVRETDVVIENFRPGVMSRLGIGERRLRRINRRLIFCSISGYGQNSAWSQRPGHDLNFQAEAGLLSLNRSPDGPPVVPGVLVADYLAGVYAALSVVTSLYERSKTGRGNSLDVSMFECALSTMNIMTTKLLYTGEAPVAGGFSFTSELPNYTIYETKDGRYLAVAALEPKFWEIFCTRAGCSGLADRCPTGPDPSLREIVARVIVSKSYKEWVKIFANSDCCVSPVQTLREALAHLPARERAVVTHMEHPILGRVPQLMSPTAGRNGKHGKAKSRFDSASETVRVLKKLGYSASQIKQLSVERVIPSGVSTRLP